MPVEASSVRPAAPMTPPPRPVLLPGALLALAVCAVSGQGFDTPSHQHTPGRPERGECSSSFTKHMPRYRNAGDQGVQ